MCPADLDTTQAWSWLAGVLLLVAYLAGVRYVHWRNASQRMRTADADRIEREAQALRRAAVGGNQGRGDPALGRRRPSSSLLKVETTYGTDPGSNVHPLHRTVVQSVRDADYPTQRAAVVREAAAAARADFALHGRRRANPYTRHSPLFALWAIEYEDAFGVAAGDEPEQHA